MRWARVVEVSPRQPTVRNRGETVTLRVVDAGRWSLLCLAIRADLEPRLVEVGERLAESDLTLRAGEEDATRDYLLALDAYAAAGKLLDEATEPPDLAGVAVLIDIAAAHFAAALARHVGRTAPHRRVQCFYNPLHGPASTGSDASRRPKKRVRQAVAQQARFPMCADCKHRARANEPLDVLPAAVTVRTGRRGRALVAVPYFAVPRERSLWTATGYGSLPGSSDAELVRRVLGGEYRLARPESDKPVKRRRLAGRRS